MNKNASGDVKRGWISGLWVIGLAALLVSSCAELPPPAAMQAEPGYMMAGASDLAKTADAAPVKGQAAVAGAPEMARRPTRPRPGLGTTWGKYVSSPMTYTGFVRESAKPAGGVATIWYNDREGIDAMTGKRYSTGSGKQRAAGGLVEWGIKSGLSTLRSYHWNGKRFVVGRDGARYSIVVTNHARSRLEVVLTVDGLDVVDGQKATVTKRGYIIWPGQTLEVKGWRSSEREVASFRFSSVSNSYSALKHGTDRNVGVIGMAVFTEKGIDPWNGYTGESARRFSASPFAEAPVHRAR